MQLKIYGIMIGIAILMAVSHVWAVGITVDADGFGDDMDISDVFAGVTLSSVGDYPGLDGRVYAHSDGLASTGVSVFANNLAFERQWNYDWGSGFALRADFDYAADTVVIDLIGDNPADFDIGGLYAYDSDDVLLDSVVSGNLVYGEIFRAQISRLDFDIAYIIAGGAGAETVHLDNLAINVIPEPISFLLLAMGGGLLRRRKF
ncbi:MAG: hypothetical protein JW860_11235 [Sedimentisphaerales bacterium]|nr:hypothetical protein [Sedimentisphaerales bacterium]